MSANASNTNFYYSFLFLPPEKRRAIEAVYAFARRGDDLADEGLTSAQAREGVALYRKALDECYAECVTNADRSPKLTALAEAVRRYKIPRRPFEDLILGLEMDLNSTRYETFEDLRVYCYRVAATIGLISIEIFGYRNPGARDYAVQLGTALQLVNILRDISSDARRGRVYLPGEDLERFGVTRDDILAGRSNDRLVELVRFESNRAREYFERARRALPAEDRRSLVAAEIMGAIYWRILERIRRRRYNVWGEPIRLSRPLKFWTAISVYLKSGI